MFLLLGFVSLMLLLWVFDRYYLRGNQPDELPASITRETTSVFTAPQTTSAQQLIVNETISDLGAQILVCVRKRNLLTARAIIDSISDGRDYNSTFYSTDANGVPAEWVLAPTANPTRRVLYIHGGGFMMGSPKSHRSITSKFSEITGCAVLAIDYRLMPEYKFRDCVEDCRAAYHWILDNGPNGPEAIRQLYFGGDSAGGNLALSLVAWVRDNKLRAPDAVVALSPLTDNTFSGASVRGNEATDIMLAPILGLLNKLPQFIKRWWLFWTLKVRPASPIASPLFGDLTNLPPTLVQASEAEMLLDDARRYAHQARAAGSPVDLQLWEGMAHVWQIFVPQLPQAVEAWKQIGKFLETASQRSLPRSGSENASVASRPPG